LPNFVQTIVILECDCFQMTVDQYNNSLEVFEGWTEMISELLLLF